MVRCGPRQVSPGWSRSVERYSGGPIATPHIGDREERLRSAHDRGGWPTDGPIDQSEHPIADWEWQTHDLLILLMEKGLMNSDEVRRSMESLPLGQYESLSYYERWSPAIETLLIEKNLLTVDEIDAKVRALEGWGK